MRITSLLILALLVSTPALAAVELQPNHPERYTVIPGDTLWAIAGKFLKDPWRWTEVWKQNDQIKNPHLIYPGDVMILTFNAKGEAQIRALRSQRLTVKLSPAIFVEPIQEAITTIPPKAIQPFLSQPLVVDDAILSQAGYVTVGVNNEIILGKYQRFYARGIKGKPGDLYNIFRPGEKFKHPETGEALGLEAVYLGEARLLVAGDPAKLEVTRAREEITPTDRMLPTPEESPLPRYHPRAPETEVQGHILSVLGGVHETGSTSIVAISLGKRDGLKQGHVLNIQRHAGTHKDPVTKKEYSLPDEISGQLLVFRIFERVSYGFILEANRPIKLMDTVRTP